MTINVLRRAPRTASRIRTVLGHVAVAAAMLGGTIIWGAADAPAASAGIGAAWTSIGRPAACGQGQCDIIPTVANWGPGRSEVFTLVKGQIYHHATEQPAAGWDMISPLPNGRHYVGIAVTSPGAGAINIVADDTEGGMWFRTYLGSTSYRPNGWYAWSAINPPPNYNGASDRSYHEPSVVIARGEFHVVVNWNGDIFHCLYAQPAPGHAFQCTWTNLGSIPESSTGTAAVIDQSFNVWQVNWKGELYERTYEQLFPSDDPSQPLYRWTDWTASPVPPGGFPYQTPAVAADGLGHTIIAVGNPYSQRYTVDVRSLGLSTWSWWHYLNPVPPGDSGPLNSPAVTLNAVGPAYRVDIFATGFDGNIYQHTQTIT